MSFRKATRQHAKLRLALIGPAGTGKTYSALALATHLVPNGRIAVIDTECGSAELYANRFSFDTMDLANHSPLEYVQAIEAAEREGYDVIILDSLSHAWMGRDGALEQIDKAVERGAGNSFSAWRTVTPKHNKLVDKMLACKAHLIATVRAKTEYVLEANAKGKMEPKKIGMAAIQREGLDFEFTLVGDLDYSNTLRISKTRLDGFIVPGDVFERPGAMLAGKIRAWLDEGAPFSPVASAPAAASEPLPEVRQFVADMAASEKSDALGKMIDAGRAALDRIPDEPASTTQVADAVSDTFAAYLRSLVSTTTKAELDKAAAGPGRPAKGTPEYAKALDVYKLHAAAIAKRAGANGTPTAEAAS